MDPEYEHADSREDVDMLTVPDAQPQEDQPSGQDAKEPQQPMESNSAGGAEAPVADMELPLKTGKHASCPCLTSQNRAGL